MAYFNTGYYRAMDSDYVSAVDPEFPELEEPIKAKQEKEDNIELSPSQVGVGTNPFVHPTQGVNARLHDGASKMEITFFGRGKGNKEQFTPESIGKEEREDLRNLMRVNNAKLSTHATVAVEGLAGFGREGFDEMQRAESMKEIEKAIDFASEATTGGAIVFHTGEWQRPISEQKFGTSKGGQFEGFETENEKAAFYTVDKETGKISGIRKDQKVYEPEFLTVKTFSEEFKLNQDKHGNYLDDKGEIVFEFVGIDESGDKKFKDKEGNRVYEDEWVDNEGKFISPDPEQTDRWFERIPKWNKEKTHFDVRPLTYVDFEKQAEKFNKRHGLKLSPEELYVKSQIGNEVLKARGASLFHGHTYDELVYQRKKLLQAKDYFKKLTEQLPEDEKWRLEQQRDIRRLGLDPELDILPTTESKLDYIERNLKNVEDRMRHVHESSAAADAQAQQAEDSIKNIQTIHQYGIDKTASSIAKLARKVYQKNKQKAFKEQEDLYLAPENWQVTNFGGHPEEMAELVEKSRKTFIEQNKNMMGEKEAKDQAKKLIKSTIDIGHLNQWRKHFKRKEDESDQEFHKRFNKWMLKEVDKMHEKGVLGHFHLTDNFGYDDEHLTPGQGNAPIKEFVKKLKEKGYEDFIIEAGSFNPVSSLHDTWSYFGTPVYSTHPRGSFRNFHQQHFKYKSTPLYIAGAYAPSNDFKAWSEVPLH